MRRACPLVILEVQLPHPAAEEPHELVHATAIQHLDATLGLINLEQNQIIKIFSVAAVVFLPPTLVASIYGMNFDVIPELKFEFGYPMALFMMVLSAYLPFLYFKRRGWL